MKMYFVEVENCKVYVSDILISNGDDFTIDDKGYYYLKIVADEGYNLINGLALYNGYDISFTPIRDGSKFNDDLTIFEVRSFTMQDVHITAKAVLDETVPPVEPPKERIKLNLIVENATMYINDEQVFNNDFIDLYKDDVVKFKANNKYLFNSPILLSNIIGENIPISFSSGYYNQTFTECIVTGEYLLNSNYDLNDRIFIKAEEMREPEPTDPPEDIENDYISIYTPTQKQLSDLSKLLYEIRNGETSTQFLDINAYIKGLYILPFNIDSYISEHEFKMQIGSLALDVYSRDVNKSSITIDLGEIEIPLIYNNAFDYMDTECYLYLPYSKKVNLDVSYVVGQTIRIEYIINLYNRETTINAYSTITGHVVYTETVDIGYDIPYVQQTNFDMLQKFNYNGLNKYAYPYIELVRKVPYEQKFIYSEEHTKLIGKIGYYEVDNIQLNTKATSQEQDEIKRLISQGIIIK